jgi:hypothetical protein
MAVKKTPKKGGRRQVTEEQPMKPLLVSVPEKLRTALKMYAVSHGITVKDFVTEAIEAALKKGGEK